MPDTALWNPSIGKWEVGPRPGAGAPDGECLRYRPDGTLFSRSTFVGGVEQGPFTVYHPDGTVAREGRFEGGLFEGLVRAFAHPDSQGEPLRVCCVPPTAVRLDTRYRGGEMLAQVFYDREGREVLSDGSPCPPRPAGLPEIAVFEEARDGWCIHTREVDRYWSREGRVVEENLRVPDHHRLVRTYDETGAVLEEHTFASDGRRDGAFRRRYPHGPAPYADARIREERGDLAFGQGIGRWVFLDGDGALVRTAERGLPFDPASIATSPAFADRLDDGWALAGELEEAGRVREAACAAARAGARGGDRARLEAWLDARILPLASEIRARSGEALAQSSDATAVTVLDALLGGTDAAAAFRALASVLPAGSAAALELVEASLLLAPERRMTHLTRALIRLQRGDEAGARADAAIVEAESPGAAESLLGYTRLLFRPQDPFPPAREPLVPDPELPEAAATFAQALEPIRRLVGVYATRIARVRERLSALGISADSAWMPPDVSALLPDGPVSLLRERIACEPEGGVPAGTEPEFVDIDETIGLDEERAPTLAVTARADYGALAWLCWATGLDRVALPTSAAPPAALPAAMQMIVKRHWRAHDRSQTGGLLAMSQRVPGFVWEGLEIDVVPPHALWIVVAEYLAARSMFLWLASPDALTPFQDDIRDA